ncbi:unnamed protein product [Amoebophrya sp. A120]|nr:unnamed protein product [Amoebophrya sp. A120]|eukprot:GSA120T00009728001.1
MSTRTTASASSKRRAPTASAAKITLLTTLITDFSPSPPSLVFAMKQHQTHRRLALDSRNTMRSLRAATRVQRRSGQKMLFGDNINKKKSTRKTTTASKADDEDGGDGDDEDGYDDDGDDDDGDDDAEGRSTQQTVGGEPILDGEAGSSFGPPPPPPRGGLTENKSDPVLKALGEVTQGLEENNSKIADLEKELTDMKEEEQNNWNWFWYGGTHDGKDHPGMDHKIDEMLQKQDDVLKKLPSQ